MSTLGKYISEQRAFKNLSIRKLAKIANLSHTEISRLESGERKNPSPLVLKSISHALNINFDDLMRSAGYTDEAENSSESALRLFKIQYLNEKELEEVSDFIDFLLSKRNQHH
jgi:transcriptional regulator with XRE-family HTH domain